MTDLSGRNLKRKQQNTDETNRKTKQLKLTDMFTNQEIPKTSEDTNVDPTLDENANKKYDEIAQMAYEIIVNKDEDVPMLCVTRKKRTKKPKNHTRNKRRKTNVENRIRLDNHDNSRPVFV